MILEKQAPTSGTQGFSTSLDKLCLEHRAIKGFVAARVVQVLQTRDIRKAP